MNGGSGTDKNSYRTLLLMSEIDKGEQISQRDLSSRLGIALGLVNSYLKNLAAKGFVRVKRFPRNRYAYLLTPKGVAEKSRLAYQHLSYFTSLYKVARQDYTSLLRALHADRVQSVAFCGVDEVAEIAYLSLCEVGIELSVVMDDERAGGGFFGRPVISLAEGVRGGSRYIVITSLKKRDALREELLRLGCDGNSIYVAGTAGSTKVMSEV